MNIAAAAMMVSLTRVVNPQSLNAMDPVFLTIMITLLVLASGGATVAVRKRRQEQQRLRLRDSLRSHRRLEDQRVSLFDVFWDLGASDFALELMAHHQLLPNHEDEAYGAWSRLEGLIGEHGNYSEFLDDSLEAIQEFYEQHRHAGNRRLLPGLTQASSRIIPIPKRLESDLESREPSSELATIPDEEKPPSTSTVRERQAFRVGRRAPGLMAEMSHDEVDLDHIGDFSPLDVLRSVVDGNLGLQLEKWWKTRRLRQKRQELDVALEAFYDFYANTARRDKDFYEPLYDAHLRWRDEAARLRMMARRRPWAGQPWELTADVLFEDAIHLSESLASRAYQSTYYAIESIHDYARRDEKSMAGYLVFLNRHAFFAGRTPKYADYARDIEFATQRVREEILRLRDDGVV